MAVSSAWSALPPELYKSDLYGGTAPLRLTAAQREAAKPGGQERGVLLMSQSSQAMGCVTIETLPASPLLYPGVWNRPSMLGADLFAFAAANAILIAIDEVFHAAVLFGPVMDSGRTDIHAVTAVDAFVV